MTDLLGGHLSMYFGGVMVLLPHVKSGKLKGLAVSTRKRSKAAPAILVLALHVLPIQLARFLCLRCRRRLCRSTMPVVIRTVVKILDGGQACQQEEQRYCHQDFHHCVEPTVQEWDATIP